MSTLNRAEMIGDLLTNYSSLWTRGVPSWPRLELPQGAIAVFTGIVLILQFLASVPIILLIMYLIASSRSLRKLSVYIMIFKICLGELIFQIPFVLGNLYYFFIDRNDLICAIAGFVDSIICASSAVFYAHLAINRYGTFYHEHLSRTLYTPRNTILLLAVTWALIIAAVLPLWPYMGYEVCHFCGLNAAESKFATLYSAAGLGSEAIIGIAILLFCNLKVSQKLRLHRLEMGTRGMKQKAAQRETLENVMRLLYFHAFVTPWFALPGIITRFVPGVENVPWVGRFVGLMVSMEPCVTPYLIIHWMRPLREATWAFLGKRFGLKRNKVRPSVSFSARAQSVQLKSIRSQSTFMSTSG